ncbi:hypothetical protein GGX14DRAFT_446563, partial [Mycena pura]
NARTRLECEAQEAADYRAASNWINGPDPCNCEEALELLKMVPPINLGGESTQTKDMSKSERTILPPSEVILESYWLDVIMETIDFRDTAIPSRERRKLATYLHKDRRTPPETERVERWTDDFHKQYILEPACLIAGFVTSQPMATTYSACSGGVISDLHVQAQGESGKKFITVENKRGLVWAEHEKAFLELLKARSFPTIMPAVKPAPAVRICIQVNAQMATHDVLYAKLFSPVAVVYVRRDPRTRRLFFSRVYRDLDDDVRRTACLLILAFNAREIGHALSLPSISSVSSFPRAHLIFSWIQQQALKVFLTVSTLCGIPTVAVGLDGRWSLFYAVDGHTSLTLPRIFSRFIGAGASGNVWQSIDGSHVIKIFSDGEAARNEAEILQRCSQDPELAVPPFCGLYTDGQEHFAIVTPYAGNALGSIYEAEESERRQLVEALHALHRNGIHHHDIRSENVLVNEQGRVTLIDFDRASKIDGPCENCSDHAVITAMEGYDCQG